MAEKFTESYRDAAASREITKHWKLSKHSKEDEHYMLACSSDLLQACVVGYWNPEQMVI